MTEIETTEHDRRGESRRRTLLSGTMQFGNGTTTRTCSIRNLSPHGARLEVQHAGWMDRRFTLLPSANLPRRSAEIVWREPNAIGVRFTDEADESSLESEVNRLRNERDKLKLRIRTLTDET
jgi:PilZ domain